LALRKSLHRSKKSTVRTTKYTKKDRRRTRWPIANTCAFLRFLCCLLFKILFLTKGHKVNKVKKINQNELISSQRSPRSRRSKALRRKNRWLGSFFRAFGVFRGSTSAHWVASETRATISHVTRSRLRHAECSCNFLQHGQFDVVRPSTFHLTLSPLQWSLHKNMRF